MAWLDMDATLTERYPALAELVQQMHLLPYELNRKTNPFLYKYILLTFIPTLRTCTSTILILFYFNSFLLLGR